jgi:hypothetical protein
VVSLTISSLTRLMVEVDVRTVWGRGADKRYESSAVICISQVPMRDLSRRGRNDDEALSEVGRVAKAAPGDPAMFGVVQLQVLSHGFE